MCLQALNIIPKERERGYGFKCVKLSDTADEFVGQWPYFCKGHGGTLPTDTMEKHRNGVIWKLGRMYRVKHNRSCFIDDDWNEKVSYHAGVHLYKHFTSAWGSALNSTRMVVLVCYYTSGKFEDHTQLVAMRCTPIIALRTKTQTEIFRGLIQSYGVERAITIYQKKYMD